VRCRHSAEWRPRELEGGGDLHSATLRGRLCEVRVGCDPETGYKTQMRARAGARPVMEFSSSMPGDSSVITAEPLVV
jgi:hypothetical protein